MNTNNPFTPPIERIHLTERGEIEEQRITAVNIANNTRFSLYPYIRDLLAQAEQLRQPEQPVVAPEPTNYESGAQVVPESLNSVVTMMEQANHRDLTAQEKQLADAKFDVAEAFSQPISANSHEYRLL